MSARHDTALARIRHLKRGLPAPKLARKIGSRPRLNRLGGAWRGAAWLLMLLLFIATGRFYLTQRLDLSGQAEHVLRAQIGPQLEKQLGAKVEFGEVETDWLGRVVVHDIFIGRNAKLPTGALARAQSVTLSLDLPGLALGRAAFPGAIRAVAAQNPQLYLRRDARGLNWAKMLGRGAGGQKTSWSGHVSLVDGRIYYLDTTIFNAQKQPLLLDARAVNASFDALQNAPYRFAARAGAPLLGAQKLQLPPLSTQGALEQNAKNGIFTLDTDGVPFAPLASYAFPHREIVARAGSGLGADSGGTLGGRVVFTLFNGVLAPHGALSLQNLAFSTSQVKTPGTTRPLVIDSISGPLEFAGRAFSTPGARVVALGTSAQIAGAASLEGEAPFDFEVRTAALPLAALRPLWPRDFGFSSAAAPLRAHLSGSALGKNRQIQARGTLETPNARGSSTSNRASAIFGTLQTEFAFSANLRPDNSLSGWKIAARGAAPHAEIALPSGQFTGRDADFTLRAAQGGGVEIGARARGFRAFSARYGVSSGQNFRLTASAPDALHPEWSGTLGAGAAATSGLKLTAFSPALAHAVRGSGALGFEAQFAGLTSALDARKVRAAATFGLASLQLDPRAFASTGIPLRPTDFSLRSIRGRLALGAGHLELSRAAAISGFGPLRLDASVPLASPQAARVALSLPQASVDPALLATLLRPQQLDLAGQWRGRVTLLSRASSSPGASPRFGLDLDLRAPSSRLRGLERGSGTVALVGPQLQVRGELGVASSWKGTGTLRAENASFTGGKLGALTAIPAEFSGARASGLRLDFGAQSGASSNRARLSARTLSVPVATTDGARGPSVLPLQNLSADLETGRAGTSIPRFSVRFGGGQVRGAARFTPAGPQAQFLASGIDVARVQQLLAPGSSRNAPVTGLASALVEVRPGAAPRAQVRLLGGAVRLVSGAKTTVFPLQNARATLLLAPGAVKIRDALMWSDGARLAGDATQNGAIWTGTLDVSGASLARLATLPMVQTLPPGARPLGLAGGQFTFDYDARPARFSRLSGTAQLQLAEVFGAQIESLGAQVSLQSGLLGAPRLALSDLKGEIEGAPVTGLLSADLGSGTWSAGLKFSGVKSARLARLQALQTGFNPGASGSSPGASGAGASGAGASGADSRDTVLGRTLPLRGEFGGEIQLTGALRDAQGEWAVRAREGEVHLTSGELIWRGRKLGALRADASLKAGVVHAQTLQLAPVPREGAAAEGENGLASASTPLVQISGSLPLDPGAAGLDARVHIAPLPLGYFTDALAQSRDALRTSGLAIPFFERAVAYVGALPRGTTGQVALDASLSGSWNAPRVQVSGLTLREGRTRLPSGGFSPPATLDAAFTFDRGALAVERAEFKIKKSAPAPLLGSALGRPAPDAAEEDDTLLRVEPGGVATPDGPISLAADVFNANLSQLSPWVPALRTGEGAPLLRGELSEFSFRVGGTTLDPAITGSIQGENLALENYTLDRLRVSRFEIGRGALRIAPGNLTVVKGAFQSSAPFGSVPWDWTLPGPVMDGPIDVHFPLQTRDFGALVGAFVPALSVADADEFAGSVDVAGTLRSPSLSGAITIRGGQFRLEGQRNPFAAGLREVSGTVRFVGATQILIDADDPLRGQLVSASSVVGRIARRPEPGETPLRAAVAAGGPDPGSGQKTGAATKNSKAKSSGAAKTGTAKVGAAKTSAANTGAANTGTVETDIGPKLAGEFVLRGDVVRPAQIDALLETPLDARSNGAVTREERRAGAERLRALLDPAAALSRLKYDLSLEFKRGAFASDGLGGVSDVSAGLIWKTGVGDAQNVRWMIAARGQKGRQSKNGGDLTSFGALALRRDFASGIDALARSGARDFSGESDFSGFDVAKRVDVAKAPDRRAQVSFNRFAAGMTGTGSGVVDGRLVLDNGASQQQAPASAVKLQNAALKTSLRASRFGSRISGDFSRDFALTAPATQVQDVAETNLAATGTAATDVAATDVAATDVAATDVAATDVAATDVAATDVAATDVAATSAADHATARKNLVANGVSTDSNSDGNSSDVAPEDEVVTDDGAPLRLGGVLTLSSAEIYGAPAGGDGAALLLSRLPGAPRFDVRLKMGRDVQIVTAAFRSGLEGEMVAKGSPSDPQISGILTTVGGQVRFPNARARVEEGRVTLALSRDAATDSLRTRLDIDATARGQAGRYAITLRLRGPLDLSAVQNAQTLQIDVTSNPPLSQSEALQQLLGTVPALDYDEKTGLYKTGSVNRAYTNAVLNVLSAPLFSGVEQSLAQTLGLTSVGFEYRFNEPLAVQVTKALGDRVFVSYRRSLGSGPTGSLASSASSSRTPFELRIEYRLKGSYLLGLQTDERQIPSIIIQKTRQF